MGQHEAAHIMADDRAAAAGHARPPHLAPLMWAHLWCVRNTAHQDCGFACLLRLTATEKLLGNHGDLARTLPGAWPAGLAALRPGGLLLFPIGKNDILVEFNQRVCGGMEVYLDYVVQVAGDDSCRLIRVQPDCTDAHETCDTVGLLLALQRLPR